MPIFRFETTFGDGEPDLTDVDLADAGVAQIEAVHFLGELLKDGSALWQHEQISVTVSDRSGLSLFRLDLSATRSASLPRGRRSGEPRVS